MTKFEKIIDWGLILITLVGVVLSFVFGPRVEFKVTSSALFIMMLARLIKNKAIALSIMGICFFIILFVGIKLFLTL